MKSRLGNADPVVAKFQVAMHDSRPTKNVQLEKILADYLRRVEIGEKIDRQALLRQHPDLADELVAFFSDDAQIEVPGQCTADYSEAARPAPDETVVFDSSASDFANPSGPQAVGKIGYFGDYELLEEIARGGMGVVYKARQMNLDRTVALKMILAGRLASNDDIRRFYREAESAANLEHPGIVPIYEIGQQQGQHFYSMALVDGPSLADILSDGPLTAREAAQVVQQVAEAIAYAHSRGVVHRDLKPANVLLAHLDGRGANGSKRTITIGSTPDHPERAGFTSRGSRILAWRNESKAQLN